MMNYLRLILVGVFGCCSLALAEPTKLFDGQSLDGWKVDGASYWKAVDGILVGESDQHKKNSILWTKKSYQDFSFECEFRYEGKIDSGVFLRDFNEQIQIGISSSLKRDMTGSPYIANKRGYPSEAKGVADLLKQGEWNKLRIVAKGAVYTVTLNGKQVLEYRSDSAVKKGPIGLQVHPGRLMKIEFKDLKIDTI